MSPANSRRRFLTRFTYVAAGGALGAVARLAVADREADAGDPPRGSAEARLKQLGIELPPAPNPVAVYVPSVRVGDVLYTSGHGPSDPHGELIRGKVGAELSLAEGKQAARRTGLNVLSTVRAAVGSLDRVVRLVKVLGMVNCTPEFDQQPQVINGFSELMVDVFGERQGKGARSAVGVAALPSNIAVEIEAIFQIRG